MAVGLVTSLRLGDQFCGPGGNSANPEVRRSFLRGSWRLCTPSLGAILLAIGVSTDTSNLLINVSNRTQSTWLQSRELLMPLPLGAILSAISVNTDTSNSLDTQGHKHSYQTSSYSICTKCIGTISDHMFQSTLLSKRSFYIN